MKRRDLMKLGAGVVTTALAGQRAAAQRGGGRGGEPQAAPPPGSMPSPDEPRPHTGPGYKNDYNRLAGNGPMDDTTRKIVKYVHDFKESDMTPSNRVDSLRHGARQLGGGRIRAEVGSAQSRDITACRTSSRWTRTARFTSRRAAGSRS